MRFSILNEKGNVEKKRNLDRNNMGEEDDSIRNCCELLCWCTLCCGCFWPCCQNINYKTLEETNEEFNLSIGYQKKTDEKIFFLYDWETDEFSNKKFTTVNIDDVVSMKELLSIFDEARSASKFNVNTNKSYKRKISCGNLLPFFQCGVGCALSYAIENKTNKSWANMFKQREKNIAKVLDKWSNYYSERKIPIKLKAGQKGAWIELILLSDDLVRKKICEKKKSKFDRNSSYSRNDKFLQQFPGENSARQLSSSINHMINNDINSNNKQSRKSHFNESVTSKPNGSRFSLFQDSTNNKPCSSDPIKKVDINEPISNQIKEEDVENEDEQSSYTERKMLDNIGTESQQQPDIKFEELDAESQTGTNKMVEVKSKELSGDTVDEKLYMGNKVNGRYSMHHQISKGLDRKYGSARKNNKVIPLVKNTNRSIDVIDTIQVTLQKKKGLISKSKEQLDNNLDALNKVTFSDPIRDLRKQFSYINKIFRIRSASRSKML